MNANYSYRLVCKYPHLHPAVQKYSHRIRTIHTGLLTAQRGEGPVVRTHVLPASYATVLTNCSCAAMPAEGVNPKFTFSRKKSFSPVMLILAYELNLDMVKTNDGDKYLFSSTVIVRTHAQQTMY